MGKKVKICIFDDSDRFLEQVERFLADTIFFDLNMFQIRSTSDFDAQSDQIPKDTHVFLYDFSMRETTGPQILVLVRDFLGFTDALHIGWTSAPRGSGIYNDALDEFTYARAAGVVEKFLGGPPKEETLLAIIKKYASPELLKTLG